MRELVGFAPMWTALFISAFAQDFSCPEGATLSGAVPPDGNELWCTVLRAKMKSIKQINYFYLKLTLKFITVYTILMCIIIQL